MQVLCDVLTAVQQAESRPFRGKDLETVATAHRWRY
jgi:hypothetical protein